MWFGPFPLLKHFQDCDDSGGQLEWMYPNCSCLFHNYLLTPFEAFRWKVDGSSIVSGITEVKEPQMTIVQVKGALHSGALRLCGMNRMNMCWKKKQCVEMRRVEQTYRNWHCSLLFSDSWPSIASGTQQGTNLIRAISWLQSPVDLFVPGRHTTDATGHLYEPQLRIPSEVPAIEGETWRDMRDNIQRIQRAFWSCTLLAEMTEVRQGRLGDGANVILWCLSQPLANRSSSEKHRATVRATAIACQ